MQVFQANGHEIINEIPLLSITEDENGRQYQDHGWFKFKETIIHHGNWYAGMLELVDVKVLFFNYYVVGAGDLPDVRTGYVTPSYYQLRTWLDSVVKNIADQILAEYPNVTRYDDKGAPIKQPTQEDRRKAYELFKEAKPQERPYQQGDMPPAELLQLAKEKEKAKEQAQQVSPAVAELEIPKEPAADMPVDEEAMRKADALLEQMLKKQQTQAEITEPEKKKKKKPARRKK